MSGLGASAGLAIVLGWVIFALAGWALSPVPAVVLGGVAGAALVAAFRDSVAIGGMMALLAPFGVMLPALALRHAAVKLGVAMPPFATWELLVFVGLYTAFLATAFGVIPLEVYRLGYAPLPVTLMALAVCAYALATGNWFVAVVAVTGQAAWTFGWGSSNWFDHVLHAALWPVAVVALVTRLF
ncbi:hypothetical protein [Roseovarius salis]|uniref:hypothetical protein n=1 Tax=Roseovarius salis TaxID=3376063 RepID=UPI0037C665B0